MFQEVSWYLPYCLSLCVCCLKWCWQLPSCAQYPACVVSDLLGITLARWQSLRPEQSASTGQSSPIMFSSTQTMAWGTTTTAGTRMGELHPGASTGLHQGPSAGLTVTVVKVRTAACLCRHLGWVHLSQGAQARNACCADLQAAGGTPCERSVVQ